jgi:uncharacterized protein YbjT (DUF2867 family)
VKRILVTGGGGTLGRSIVQELQRRALPVRVMLHRSPPRAEAGVDWVRADVATGEGLEAALQGVEAIVNCASSPRGDTYETDVAGTRRLLAAARAWRVQRGLHISIIGIDRIIYPYYQYKLGAELAVVESGMPYTIARIAQFHDFLDSLLSPLRAVAGAEAAIPVDAQFQPISTADAARHLAPHILSGEPIGRLPDFGGPEVLKLRGIAAAWLQIRNIRCEVIPASGARNDLPRLDTFGEGFAKGYNTNPANRVGDTRWADYLRQTYRVAP